MARTTFRHPVNQKMAESESDLGPRIADAATAFIGSWRFLVIQTIFVAIWITGNVIMIFRFDLFPFILLNLAFSTQAAYAAPLILLAGNREVLRDRMTLEHAASQSDVEEEQNEKLLKGNTEILEKVAGLEKQILELEQKILGQLASRPSEAT